MVRIRPIYLIPIAAAMGIFALLAATDVTPAAGLPQQLAARTKGTMVNFTLSPDLPPAPAIKFRDENGGKHDLTAFAGKVVLINFWATWCGPCRREMADLDRLQEKLGGDGFTVLALSSDRKGMEVVKKFYAENKIRHLAAWIDRTTKAQRAFGAYGLPTSVLIDRRGRQVGRLVGPAEWASDEAIALIKTVIDATDE